MAGIIELARFGLELMIRNNCLLIMENGISRSVTPLREISAVLIANPAVSLSGYVLTALAERHIPLICSRKRDACDSFYCRIPHTNATSLLKMEKKSKIKAHQTSGQSIPDDFQFSPCENIRIFE